MSNTDGVSQKLTVITPIHPGNEDGLRAWLEGLPKGDDSPFSALGRTHFVRCVVIDGLVWEGPPQVKDHLSLSYLLFSVVFDGEVDSYLRAMCARIPNVIDQIWGRCVGYPGRQPPSRFLRYMLHNRIDATFFLSGTPNATVEDIRRALTLRGQVRAFVRAAQGLEPRELQARFRAAWPAWMAPADTTLNHE